MKHIIVILLIVLVVILCCKSYYEGFTPYGLYNINAFKGGNGVAPPGVNALPGKEQMVENATSQHVASFEPNNCITPFAAEYKQQPN